MPGMEHIAPHRDSTEFLLQWPTLITLMLFPVLLVIYARLAIHEERDVLAEFGEAYAGYMKRTPAFWPDWRRFLGNKVG